MTEDRATRIVDLATRLGMDPIETCYDVMDDVDSDLTELHRLIRDSFQSDDDFDDMKHEIEHEIDVCSDDNPDCPWGDDDDDA